ncbi:cartilage acidic protein 1-like [Arapaima gigas]
MGEAHQISTPAGTLWNLGTRHSELFNGPRFYCHLLATKTRSSAPAEIPLEAVMMNTVDWLLFMTALSVSCGQRTEPMFMAVTDIILPPDYHNNPTQLNYGMAVTDVDGDGDLEILVAG